MTPELIVHFEGWTSEGGYAAFVAWYGSGDMPYRIHGSYASWDGGGVFDVEGWGDLPCVVCEGEYRCVFREFSCSAS